MPGKLFLTQTQRNRAQLLYDYSQYSGTWSSDCTSPLKLAIAYFWSIWLDSLWLPYPWESVISNPHGTRWNPRFPPRVTLPEPPGICRLTHITSGGASSRQDARWCGLRCQCLRTVPPAGGENKLQSSHRYLLHRSPPGGNQEEREWSLSRW